MSDSEQLGRRRTTGTRHFLTPEAQARDPLNYRICGLMYKTQHEARFFIKENYRIASSIYFFCWVYYLFTVKFGDAMILLVHHANVFSFRFTSFKIH
ncbi:MAG: hypothetical protein IT292_00760 [Deltaproteobacteria bacterium]|nr:hypothetical protein [Deltaproteobacteria bacterium]